MILGTSFEVNTSVTGHEFLKNGIQKFQLVTQWYSLETRQKKNGKNIGSFHCTSPSYAAGRYHSRLLHSALNIFLTNGNGEANKSAEPFTQYFPVDLTNKSDKFCNRYRKLVQWFLFILATKVDNSRKS